MSWVLFHEGRRRPVRNPRRRLAWVIVLLVVCAAMLPFFVMGLVQAVGTGAWLDAVLFAIPAAWLVAGVVLGIREIVRFSRARARARSGA